MSKNKMPATFMYNNPHKPKYFNCRHLWFFAAFYAFINVIIFLLPSIMGNFRGSHLGISLEMLC